MKNIHTLVDDIYNLMKPETETLYTREDVIPTLNDISKALTQPLKEEKGRNYYLRPSNVGKGLRWHWFSHKYPDISEGFEGKQILLFQAGHVQEAILLMYAKLAGHTVEMEQGKVALNSISGSCDCVIDGYLIDVKTTSDYSYKKFEEGTISLDNDPFGYIAQLSVYKEGLVESGMEIKGQGWLAYNKNNSKMCLHLIPDSQLLKASKRIDTIRDSYESDTMPEDLCEGAQPVIEKSGNEAMSMKCEWCPFKDKCWPDYKVYRYANKDKYFTKINKPLRVEEVTHEYR